MAFNIIRKIEGQQQQVIQPAPLPPHPTQSVPAKSIISDPYDIVIGDIIYIGGLYREVTAVDTLYYDYAGLNTNPLTQGTSRTDNITDLQPEDTELYYIDSIGIDGQVQVQIKTPSGQPRGTPKGIPVYYDQTQANKDNPAKVAVWVLPGTYPQLVLNMPITSPSTTSDVWFYGRKFRFQVRQSGEVEAKIAQGTRILPVEVSYSP